MKPIPYQDFHHIGENERIRRIVAKVKETKGIIGVLLEKDEPKKIERYGKKLKEAYPELIWIVVGELTEGVMLCQAKHPQAEEPFKPN